MSDVDQIINDIQQSQRDSEKGESNKTASDTAREVQTAREDLMQSLGNPGSTKTANHQGSTMQADPNELEKLASDLAQAEEAALVKEAQLYGAAAWTGFLREAQKYADAAERGVQKTASVHQRDEMVKQASAKGASDVQQLLNAINGGHQKTAAQRQEEEMVKQASHKGASDMQQVLNYIQQGGINKTASTSSVNPEQEMEKLAHNCVNFFNEGHSAIEHLVNSGAI